MANLKTLKLRIRSIKATQKITRAMQMVAASKLQHARTCMEGAVPYTKALLVVLQQIVAHMPKGVHHPLCTARTARADGLPLRHRIVVMTADRGLCGAFNSHAVKHARQVADQLEQSGQHVSLLCVGKKGADMLGRQLPQAMGPYQLQGLHSKDLTYESVQAVADWLLASYRDGTIDACTLVFNIFHTVLSQEAVSVPLVPLNAAETVLHRKGHHFPSTLLKDYEPPLPAFLNDALHEIVVAQLYYAMLETMVGEQGAKMSAMDNATRNAHEMIDDLTLLFNRTRQAAITRELIEIIAGAEAV